MDAKKRLILKGICVGLQAIFSEESEEISLDTNTEELTSLQLMGVESPAMRAAARKHKAILGACVASDKWKRRKLVHVIYKVLERDEDDTEEEEVEEEDVDQDKQQEEPMEEPDPIAEPEKPPAPKLGLFDRYTAALDDVDFKMNYHISKSTARWLIDKYAVDMMGRKKVGRPPIASEITILLSLWTLTHRESFRAVSERYNVGIGHAHRVFVTFCKLLQRNQAEHLVWPDAESAGQLLAISEEFEGGDVFPGVVGCVDVTAVMFRTLKGTEPYRNDKGQNCILLQAVCDATLKFTDIFVGCPGSCTDAKVWRSSPLGKQLDQDSTSLIPEGMHLLGDSAYPLRDYLLVPYRSRCLSRAKQNYNDKLNARKAAIRQAFGQVKGRFQRLQFFDTLRIDLLSVVVSAACILHNVCIDLEDNCPEFEADDYEGEESDSEAEIGIYDQDEAFQKRDRICAQLADRL